MITTLPGLYLVSVGVIKPVVWLTELTGEVVCSTAMLRFINLLFNCGNLYLIYLLLCKLHLREKVSPGHEDKTTSDFFFFSDVTLTSLLDADNLTPSPVSAVSVHLPCALLF